jgi:TonB family protein
VVGVRSKKVLQQAMASHLSQTVLFSPLPESRKPWTEFVFGVAGQSLAIALLLWVGVLHSSEVLHPAHPNYRSVIGIVPTPAPVNHTPQQPLRSQRPVLVAHLDPAEGLRLPTPQPKPKTETVPEVAPEVKMAAKLEPLPPTAAPVIPKRPIETNVFSTGSSAPQTVAKAPDKVQTGGFGDPNGVPAKASQGKAVNIAQLGSYDLPTGPGNGNGTGGANGTRGVVASSGFGNGVSTGDNNSRTISRSVQQAGFGDAVPVASASHSHSAESTAKIIPAEILSKPAPVYTEEARGLHIEGEVLLEVVLEASGKLHVLRVVRGLGHGLDDSAVRAAEQIRFKPALRDGQPADSTAVLHIVFQLA